MHIGEHREVTTAAQRSIPFIFFSFVFASAFISLCTHLHVSRSPNIIFHRTKMDSKEEEEKKEFEINSILHWWWDWCEREMAEICGHSRRRCCRRSRASSFGKWFHLQFFTWNSRECLREKKIADALEARRGVEKRSNWLVMLLIAS